MQLACTYNQPHMQILSLLSLSQIWTWPHNYQITSSATLPSNLTSLVWKKSKWELLLYTSQHLDIYILPRFRSMAYAITRNWHTKNMTGEAKKSLTLWQFLPRWWKIPYALYLKYKNFITAYASTTNKSKGWAHAFPKHLQPMETTSFYWVKQISMIRSLVTVQVKNYKSLLKMHCYFPYRNIATSMSWVRWILACIWTLIILAEATTVLLDAAKWSKPSHRTATTNLTNILEKLI
jgi:hypothetical protein